VTYDNQMTGKSNKFESKQVSTSHPLITDVNKENVQHSVNLSYGKSALHKVNMSGDGYRDSQGRDFSISSLSSSSRNKSTGNPNSGNFNKFFEKNYFLDGEQLLRHFSPSCPGKSPRTTQNE
jgi:hypothetical protein